MKIYGYKTADSPDFFTTYTVRGFVLADSQEEAAKHFGVKQPNGFDVVEFLSDAEWERELSDNAHRLKRIEMLEKQIDQLRSVIRDTEEIQQRLTGE